MRAKEGIGANMRQTFTISMLNYQIQKAVNCTKILPDGLDDKILTWKYWDNRPLEKGYLYLFEKEQLLQNWDKLDGYCVICTSFPESELLKGNVCILMVENKNSVEIANLLQEIFYDLAVWITDVDEVLSQTGNVSRALNVCNAYLNMDLCIISDDYTIIGACDNSRFWEQNANQQKNVKLSLEFINEMTQEDEYNTVKEYDDVFIYPKDSSTEKGKEISYCYNILIKGNYFGRLVIVVSTDQDLKGVWELARLLGVYFREYFEKEEEVRFYGIRKDEFYDGVRKLLLGEPMAEDIIQKLLTFNEWSIHQNYRVLKFFFLSDISIPFYCAKLEENMQDSVALPINGEIYCIQNLSKTLKGEEKLSGEFPLFLRESLCRAGISNCSKNFFEISWCKKEADIALSFGLKYQEAYWYHWFREYILQYMIEQVVGNLPMKRLCHPSLEILSQYDKANDADLMNTLKCYLGCMENATHTAEKLFVHRTTLIHRIKKIQQLTGIDWEREDTRLHLVLSFYLMDHVSLVS